MRSVKADHSPNRVAESLGDARLPGAGQTYLERLAIVYLNPIRLTIVTELYMREMGVQEFYETIGGSSYAAVRRHFSRLIEFGWLSYTRTSSSGRGRPEKRYRSTELAVIDSETWRELPFSIRDAYTVQLLEEMGSRLGEAQEQGSANASPDLIAKLKAIEVDEPAWYEGNVAVERCFHALLRTQTDAKIRVESSGEQPNLMVVNLAAFEGLRPGSTSIDENLMRLPKAAGAMPQRPWLQRVGTVFKNRLDLAIVEELNHGAKTPTQLHEVLGGATRQQYWERCKRLQHLGWTVPIDSQTGGALHGSTVSHFRAAVPDVTPADIYRKIPPAGRTGRSWEVFERFIAAAIAAVDAGTFNRRTDRHLTESPMLVDQIGRAQIIKALKTFEGDLLRLENGLEKRRRAKGFRGFPAVFLLSSIEVPLQ